MKSDKISYVQAFMSLHNKDSVRKGNHLMMQSREVASKRLPNSKTQEEKENEMSLFNALFPGDEELAAWRLPPSALLLPDTPEIEPREATAPPTVRRKNIPLLKYLVRHPIWPMIISGGQYSIGRINQEGQPTGCCWAYILFSTSDLLNWKNSNTSYRENTQKTADLITFILSHWSN